MHTQSTATLPLNLVLELAARRAVAHFNAMAKARTLTALDSAETALAEARHGTRAIV